MLPFHSRPRTGRRVRFVSLLALGLSTPVVAQGFPLTQPQAQVLVAPALHTAAESFSPATVCATVSVPLAQSWNVGLVNGRPALALDGSPAWSFRALDT